MPNTTKGTLPFSSQVKKVKRSHTKQRRRVKKHKNHAYNKGNVLPYDVFVLTISHLHDSVILVSAFLFWVWILLVCVCVSGSPAVTQQHFLSHRCPWWWSTHVLFFCQPSTQHLFLMSACMCIIISITYAYIIDSTVRSGMINVLYEKFTNNIMKWILCKMFRNGPLKPLSKHSLLLFSAHGKIIGTLRKKFFQIHSFRKDTQALRY